MVANQLFGDAVDGGVEISNRLENELRISNILLLACLVNKSFRTNSRQMKHHIIDFFPAANAACVVVVANRLS